MSDIDSQEEIEDENWMDTCWADPSQIDTCKKSLGTGGSGTSDRVYTNSGVSNSESPSKIKLMVEAQQKKHEEKTKEKATDGGTGLMNRMRLNDNKAGMDGLDKEKINQIILEASKGSRFYENERKKEQQMNKRIEEQKIKLQQITEVQLQQGQIEADRLVEEFESSRDLSRTIVHIDMDAFYAAVEMRDNPTLKDKPMAVGGMSMLSTSNYHARKFGVRAAMPGFIGKKLCPELIIVPLNFDKYTEVSKKVREILAEYDPNFSPMSLDEAYLDLTEHTESRSQLSEYERTFLCRKNDGCSKTLCNCDLNLKLKPIILRLESLSQDSEIVVGEEDSNTMVSSSSICPLCGRPYPEYDLVTFGMSPDDAVNEMRARIEQKTRLTASAGIAPNTMLAKVCSDKNKPNGQYRILPKREKVMEFITDLPTRKISGIGKVSETMLNALGVFTCSDLYQQRALLYHLYSQISFNYFMRICRGIGSTFLERDSERKSMSTERTFSEISKPEDLFSKCEELSEALSEDLKDEELKGKTVAIKIKTVEFEVKTRAHTLADYTNDMDVIFAAAKELLRTEIQAVSPKPLRLRLMGVRMSSLLHQRLCKKKQNTLTGFIKRMTNEREKQEVEKSHDVQMTHTRDTENKEQVSDCLETESRTIRYDESSDEECNERGMDYDVNMKCTKFDQSGEDCDESTNRAKSDIELHITSKLIDQIREEINKSHKGNANMDTKGENNNIKSGEDCVMISGTSDRKNSVMVDEDKSESYLCPVCQQSVECKDLVSFNQHIDVCLNKKLVKDCTKIAHEEDRKFNKKTSSPKQKSTSVSKGKVKKKPIKFSPITSSLVSQFCKQKVESESSQKVDSSEINDKNIQTAKEKDIVINIGSNSDKDDQKDKTAEHFENERKENIVKNKTSKGKQLKKKTKQKSANNSIKNSDHTNPSKGVLPIINQEEKTSLSMDNTEILDSLNSSKCLVCPVCFMEQRGNDLDIFNEHVDMCLSKDTITEMVRNENINTPTSKHQKRMIEFMADKQVKKRQRTNSGVRPIDTFFKF